MMPSKQFRTKPKRKQKLDFEAIGTIWQIELYDHDITDLPADFEPALKNLITGFDHHYSRFRTDSLVAAMAQNAGDYTLPADAQPLFDLYSQLYRLTDGKMTPLVGQVLSDAGYDATYRLTPQVMAVSPRWEDALDYQFPRLTLKQPALLDFGAAGKGYLVDLIGGLLESYGIDSYCVDGSGDMRHRAGSSSQRGSTSVGLERPDTLDEVVGIARLNNQSLCGSAGNRRTWANGQFNHIIDPHVLQSPKHLQAVWVTADNTLLADGLTTALYFAQPAKLLKHFDFEYALIDANGQLLASTDFPADFFTHNNREDNTENDAVAVR